VYNSGVIINNNYNNFECSVHFISNNIKYSILRTGKRQTKKKKYLFDTLKDYNCYFYKYDNNDNKINISEFEYNETQNKINKIIGSYDNFCLSTVCFQNSSKLYFDFFEMNIKNRKQFLDKLLKLDIFNNVEQKYNKIVSLNKKEITVLSNSFDYKNYDPETLENIENIKIIIDNYNLSKDKELLKQYKLELNDIRNKLLPINHKYTNYSIDDLYKLLKKIPDNFNINKIKIINNNLQKKIKYSSYDIDCNIDINHEIKLINNKIKSLKYIKNKDSIIEDNKLFEINKKKNISKLKAKITNFNNEILNYYISNDMIQCLQDIHDNIIINDYTNKINNYNEQLYNLKLLHNKQKFKLNNIKKLINYDIIINDDIKSKYNNISNWKLYRNEIIDKLKNYDNIKIHT